jgi:hypothetical protein
MTEANQNVARTGGFRRFMIISGAAFVVGLAAMGWAVSSWQPARSLFVHEGSSGGIETAPGVPPITVQPQMPAAAQVAPPPDLANVTGRNEGLLVALAARRAVDNGQSLGSLDALLRTRFGDRHPDAVNTILDAARTPVTLESLSAGLEAAGPGLVSGGPDETVLNAVRRNLSHLIVVRKKGEPSPAPAEALSHVERLVESGRVEEALIAASRLPGAARAGKWLAEARRYVETRRAFDVIERSAITMPAVMTAPPAPPAAPNAGVQAPPTPAVADPNAI